MLPWLKALHVIGVVAWFAGLFYIFRLFVYHVENRDRPELVAVFEVMERRLYRAICTPAMLWTTTFGVALWSRSFTGYLSFPWFLGKLAALVALFAYHFYAGHVRRRLAAGTCRLTSRQCRALNEIPTLCLVVIVILVVVKPGM